MRPFLIYKKCFWLIAVLLAGSWAFAADGVKVGLRKQLLADYWVVAEKRGMVRKLGTVVKQNGGKPIFEGDALAECLPATDGLKKVPARF